MRKRMLLMLATMTVFIVAIGLVKFFQIRAAIAQGMAWQPPPEAVTTVRASREEWPNGLSAIGTVTAVHGVLVSADLPGIVERIEFESGRWVAAGQVLVRLDTSQERAQLAAAEAQRDLAKLNLDRATQLLERQVLAPAEHDRLAAEAKQAEARVGEIRATIQRKVIRAPFAGVLGLRQIDLGQYVNAGEAIVPLQSMDPVYVEFSLPQQEVGALRVGAEVNVMADSLGGAARGRITAINSVVDEATRSVQVQATLGNASARLRPGMFVDVQVVLGSHRDVIAIPASAVSHAPYGNSVFVVAEMKNPKSGGTYRGVRQQFVELGPARGDQVAVRSGVAAGEEVVTSGVFKLRNGAAVQVNNDRQPGNDPSPRPEDS